MIRHDSRAPKELRKITIETNVFKHPEGSVVISFGDTKVICSATVEEKVPPFLRGGGTACSLARRTQEIFGKVRKEN